MVTSWGIIITTVTFIAMLASIIAAPPRSPVSESEEGSSVPAVPSSDTAPEYGVKRAA